VLDWGSLRPGEPLYLLDAGQVEDGFRNPFDDEHVGRIAHIVVGLDHQQFGIKPGLPEMPLGGGVAQIGRRISGHVRAGVVARRVSR
jgi:hypothetical protein